MTTPTYPDENTYRVLLYTPAGNPLALGDIRFERTSRSFDLVRLWAEALIEQHPELEALCIILDKDGAQIGSLHHSGHSGI